MLGRWPGALRTVRQLHTGALRATMPRAEETVKEINKLQRTYHPLGYENSAGYLRARKPYVVSNMLIFLGLMGFVGGVYTYSIVMVRLNTHPRWNRTIFPTLITSASSPRARRRAPTGCPR